MDKSYLKNLELDKIIDRAGDYCVCREAREILLKEMPANDADGERYALSQTNAVNSLLIKNGSPRFGSVDNGKKIVQHAVKGGVLSMSDLLMVAGILRNFAGLQQWYGLTEHGFLPVDDLFYVLSPQPYLEKLITDSILSEDEIADTASSTLFDLRRKIRQQENTIRDKLDGIIKNSTTNRFLQDAVVSLRNGRFVVPVKAEYRGEMGGVIHDVSATGATVFVEPTAVVEANARIMQLRSQEQAEITRILTVLSEQVAGISTNFEFSYDAMLQIDVLLAKSRLAVAQGSFMPQVTEKNWFNLIKARHPLLDSQTCVPIDLSLGQEHDTIVITGPNTGGKTVSLKTAGLLCAMAQHGFLIPAYEGSTVCPFQNYLVDIGDEQSIEQSLSTFSGHIKKIVSILDWADDRTLVLLDELGAGTDPAEGAALAIAIIEALRRKGALILATTHYAELKVFALETLGIVNASCEFDVESLRPTYRLSVGIPGKSNAFLISERLGVPKNVIDAARIYLSNDDKRMDSVLSQLDDLKLQLKASQDEAEKAKSQAAIALEIAQRKCDELIHQGEFELEAARQKAQKIVQDVQQEAYALMDELHRLQKSEKASAAQRAARAREIARKDTEKLLVGEISHTRKSYYIPLTQVKIGQEVEIADLGQHAIVMALPDRKGLVAVRAGILKTKVPLNNLKAPDKIKSLKQKTCQNRKPHLMGTIGGRVQRTEGSRNAGMELDIRGMMVDEALIEVDQFIDHAIMNGLGSITIIHGKGTGALRAGIQQHLRTHRNIKSFRLGSYGEGDAGVTIAELK